MALLQSLRVRRSPVLGGERHVDLRDTGLINPQWIVRDRYELKLSHDDPHIRVKLTYRPAVGVDDVLEGKIRTSRVLPWRVLLPHLPGRCVGGVRGAACCASHVCVLVVLSHRRLLAG